MTSTDVYDLLVRDHLEMGWLLDELADAGDAAERVELLARIEAEFRTHADAESAGLYAVLRRHGANGDASLSREGVGLQLETLLGELRSLDPDDPDWDERVELLRESMNDHVEEVENGLFSDSRRLLSERETLEAAERFLEEKESNGQS